MEEVRFRIENVSSFRRFLTDFNLDINTRRQVHDCWIDEYKLLSYDAPKHLAQVIDAHADEVLHVAFSHDGELMSTCSKDCTLKVFINNC